MCAALRKLSEKFTNVVQMMTPAIYNYPAAPAALADVSGNVVMVQCVASVGWLEELLRPTCTAMGCTAGFSSPPLSGCASFFNDYRICLTLLWLCMWGGGKTEKKSGVLGNVVMVQCVASVGWLEELLRPTCTAMGCSAGFSSPPLNGFAVNNSSILLLNQVLTVLG